MSFKMAFHAKSTTCQGSSWKKRFVGLERIGRFSYILTNLNLSIDTMTLASKLMFVAKHPKKLKAYIGNIIRSLPFRVRLDKAIPDSYYLSYVPDRYNERYETYLRRSQSTMEESTVHGKWAKGNRANNVGDMARYYFLNLTCDQILKEGLDGDIAELGVYKGNSAQILAKLARHKNSKLYLFDTFQGFDGRDKVGVDDGVSTHFADTSVDGVRKLVGDRSVEFVVGYFPDSLIKISDDPQFCLAHIDCDLYAPFKAGLEYFYPRLVPGGWLIMHDYSSLAWEGVEKAVDEFFKDKAERLILIPDKSGTAVIRKAFQN